VKGADERQGFEKQAHRGEKIVFRRDGRKGEATVEKQQSEASKRQRRSTIVSSRPGFKG